MNQKSEYRGYALLFLNEFAGTANELPSHAKDRDNLSKSLSKMRYKVVLNENKNKQETIDILKQYAEFDHLNVDSFLCVFSSHGHERSFAANDGEVFNLTSEILREILRIKYDLRVNLIKFEGKFKYTPLKKTLTTPREHKSHTER